MIPTATLDRPEPTTDQPRSLAWDDRGVSEVLGAILMFALVILLIALIQLNAVPAANQQVEFEHNQRVQGDLQEFQGVFLRSATTNTDGSAAIEVGTSYPSRFFLFNPPDPTGTVSVGDGGQIRLENVYATGETRDYLNGDERQFDTRFLTYAPNYNEYRNPPTTVFENGVLYNEFANEQTVVSERRSFINGRTISLVALQGQYSTGTSGSLALETTPISAPGQEVSVSTQTAAPTDDPIVIHIPTRLPAEEWRAILEDELQSNGGYVLPITDDTSDGELTIELAAGETYELRVAAVGVGGEFETETDEEYIVDVSGNGETVAAGTSQRLEVQVRDEYNNPVSDVAVAAKADTGTVSFVDGNDRTDADGTATLDFDPGVVGATTEPRTVTVWFVPDSDTPAAANPDDPTFDAAHKAEFSLSAVQSGAGGPPGPPVPGDGATTLNNRITIKDTNHYLYGGASSCNSRLPNPSNDNNRCYVEMTLENKLGTTAALTELRLASYYGQGESIPDTMRVINTDTSDTEDFELASDFVAPSPSPFASFGTAGSANDDVTFEIYFDPKGPSNNVPNYNPQPGDFFIAEAVYQVSGQETSITYLVGIPSTESPP